MVVDTAVRAGRALIRVWFDGRQPDAHRFPPNVSVARVSDLPVDAFVILGMGDLKSRAEWRRRYPNASAAVLDPSAIVGHGATVGLGVVAMAGVIINANAHVARDAIVNTGSIIEHDCYIGMNVHLASGVRLGGAATVGDHAFVGVGAVILPRIRVGVGAIVAAGAVVIRDVGDGETVMGVPARARP